MKIEITITMGEDSKTMSLDEAKGLYLELGKMFGQTRSVNTGSVKRTSEEKSTGQIIAEQHVEQDAVKGNPRVEAAKNRAAARTAGCGSSRKSGCGTKK